MNMRAVFETLRRRWYVVVPGMMLAIAAAFATWSMIPPGYERSATQLLLPSGETLPDTNSNPYLFLGGLTTVADVIVRAVGSDDVVRQITAPYAGSEIEVSRDPQSSGPMILITATAPSDGAAERLIDDAIARTSEVVLSLQVEEGIPERERISVTTVTHDSESTLQQRGRITAVAGVALGIGASTLLLASSLEGLRRDRRRGASDAPAVAAAASK